MTGPFRPAAALLAILLACALPAHARDACPDGIFAADGTPFTTAAGAPAGGLVVVEGDRVTVTSLCDAPGPATVRAKRRFDVVKARWSACPPFPSKVILKAKVDAADCRTMTGVVRPKKTRPRKQKFTATRLSPVARGLVETFGSEVVAERMWGENFPYLIRPAAEAYVPELLDLVALGPEAVPAAMADLREAAGAGDETRVALLAVALELLGDPGAVPALRDWLEENLFTASLTWAPHLVTHTLKLLAGQADVHDDTFTYTTDETRDAIARTRVGAPPTAAPAATAAAVRPLAATDRVPNNCQQTIVVTGLDGNGQPTEVAIPYATFTKDIHEQIADEPDPARRAALERRRDAWRARDEEFYGASDYVPVDADADVSLRSNCGGSVLERMLNEVARRNGFPTRLGPGAATATLARDLARTFGGEVPIAQLEPLLGVISHDHEDGVSAHVEVPVERVDAENLLVFSKDVQGLPRQHVVDTKDVLNAFGWVRNVYNFRPFYEYAQTTTSFAQIDPDRVLDIRVDSGACPCGFGGGVGLSLAAPAGDEATAQRTAVSGTVDDPAVRLAVVRVNGTAQTVPVENGTFTTEVALRTGDNTLKVVVDAPDGRRGCVERTVRAPCDFTDPDDPFNGGGVVRLSVDGGPVRELPGYGAISLITNRGAVVWFGAPPFGDPYVLFELYGRRAVRAGRFEVRPNPLTDDAFTRTFAVGTFRSDTSRPGMSFRHQLVGGTLDVTEFEHGRARSLRGTFDVTAQSTEDGTVRHLAGSFDLCRFGIERRGGLDQAD